MAVICKRVTYSGRVQGVGFRYTARQVAAGFAVAGYVKNLGNGDVELVAEGDGGAVTAFLAALAGRMQSYIRGTVARDEAPAGHASFEVRP